jgi:hypothetical protein
MSKRAISALSRVTFVLAASGSAFAADMAVKAPPPPPPPPAPVYSWTGWYVGGDVGYGWGDAHTDIAGSGQPLSTYPAFCSSQRRAVPLQIRSRNSYRGSSAAVSLVIIIKSARDGCWASRPTSKPQPSGRATPLALRSLGRIATTKHHLLLVAVLYRRAELRRHRCSPILTGSGRFAGALGTC